MAFQVLEMQDYKPGLHIVSTFSSNEAALKNMQACKTFFNTIINEIGLNKVGDVYHEFLTGGYTAVVCLTESHISIHTWPEHGLATFDVFLSNYNNDNTEKARNLYNSTLAFFEATVINNKEIMR